MARHVNKLLDSRFPQLCSQISSPGNRVAGTDHTAKVVPFLIAADSPFTPNGFAHTVCSDFRVRINGSLFKCDEADLRVGLNEAFVDSRRTFDVPSKNATGSSNREIMSTDGGAARRPAGVDYPRHRTDTLGLPDRPGQGIAYWAVRTAPVVLLVALLGTYISHQA